MTLAAAAVCALADEASPSVDFVSRIQPIFETSCYQCHSADDQQSGLRLDSSRLMRRGGDRGPAIVPGKADESLLFQAIIGEGDVEPMPAEGPKLTEKQIALIKRWIDQGAIMPSDDAGSATESSDHWSFQPARRPAPPDIGNGLRALGAIDAFVLERLRQENLTPSPPADPVTLIRRLSFDLLGLPPTVDQIEQFLADTRPGAYERLVDRLLASPHYGERWGRHWLDMARYADSNGYTIDGPRSIWKYRDWVIDAYNRDLPFDEFTIEQLAGDLLPRATKEQIIATGFHRNTLINQEGGTDKEQFRVDSVYDRIATTGTVFLGLTIGCAQCHSHKLDPISQREFYELFAIFNNCDEPQIQVPTPHQTAEVKRLKAEIATAEKPLRRHDAQLMKGFSDWESRISSGFQSRTDTLANATTSNHLDTGPGADSRVPAALAKSEPSKEVWTILQPRQLNTEQGAVLTPQDDHSVFVDFSIPPNDVFIVSTTSPIAEVTAIRLEALTDASLPMMGPGRAENGNFVLSEFEMFVGADPDDHDAKPVKLTDAVADHSQEGYSIADAIDGQRSTGWAINVGKGSLNVDREALFFPSEPVQLKPGTPLTFHLRHDHRDANYLLGRFRLSVSRDSPAVLSVPKSIRDIAALPRERRTPAQQQQIEDAFKATDSARRPLAARVAKLKKQLVAVNKSIPTTMVMRQKKSPRETHIHLRGSFLNKGTRVDPAVPAVLHRLPPDVQQPTRLDFARWLTDPSNPLTARVTVNRYWQRLFGQGLVETENDFGSQGALPTHPRLLDWLATQFIGQSWSMKAIQRSIVLSATYRQSSRQRPDLVQRDPTNKLVARQSRLRLEAECIRDVALSASGLISHRLTGPPVYPPQPDGIYVLTQVKKSWPESQSEGRYRRGLYTYLWRSSLYPMLPTFDAPDMSSACTRRVRSNTPLQALTLANDRAFLELARGLARRILDDGPDDDPGKLNFAFRVCLARPASESELIRLTQFLDQQRRGFQLDEKSARLAAASENETMDLQPHETAAWTAVARVLLNLDEFITRE